MLWLWNGLWALKPRLQMRIEPRGYWTHVYDQAATLLRARPELTGDQAYWLARRLVDEQIHGPKLVLDPPTDLRLES